MWLKLAINIYFNGREFIQLYKTIFLIIIVINFLTTAIILLFSIASNIILIN